MFYIIASHIYTGVIGFVIEIVITHGWWGGSKISCYRLVTDCCIRPTVNVGIQADRVETVKVPAEFCITEAPARIAVLVSIESSVSINVLRAGDGDIGVML